MFGSARTARPAARRRIRSGPSSASAAFGLGPEVWIERDDFAEVPPKGFFRLFPGNKVRLKYGYVDRVHRLREGRRRAASPRCSRRVRARHEERHAGRRRGQGQGHDHLGRRARRGARRGAALRPPVHRGAARRRRQRLRPASTRAACASSRLRRAGARQRGADERFQFERHGYFVADRHDHAAGRPVFNRIAPLRDTWTSQADRGGRNADGRRTFTARMSAIARRWAPGLGRSPSRCLRRVARPASAAARPPAPAASAVTTPSGLVYTRARAGRIPRRPTRQGALPRHLPRRPRVRQLVRAQGAGDVRDSAASFRAGPRACSRHEGSAARRSSSARRGIAYGARGAGNARSRRTRRCASRSSCSRTTALTAEARCARRPPPRPALLAALVAAAAAAAEAAADSRRPTVQHRAARLDTAYSSAPGPRPAVGRRERRCRRPAAWSSAARRSTTPRPPATSPPWRPVRRARRRRCSTSPTRPARCRRRGRPSSSSTTAGPARRSSGCTSARSRRGASSPARRRPTLPQPFQLVDNAESLIDVADLVFVDAVGTGYSQAIAPSTNRSFWGVDSDAAAVPRLHRAATLAVNSRQASPIYLFGESYGGPRSAVLAHRWRRRYARWTASCCSRRRSTTTRTAACSIPRQIRLRRLPAELRPGRRLVPADEPGACRCRLSYAAAACAGSRRRPTDRRRQLGAADQTARRRATPW